jgi:Na+-transporting NADH:ubiquinone oxidoreductase subunit NqrC
MESEKTSRKPKRIALVLIVITLVANVVLTGINVYLTVQFNQNLTNLGFQGNMSNFTSVIIARADDSNLGKPAIYFSQEGVIEETVHHGILYAVVQVVTPHYGVLTIRLKNFDVTEFEYLSPEKRNETEISFADEKESYVYILVPGLNQINAQLYLKAQVYVNPEKLPPKDEPVQFLLGHLSLEAESFDFETQTKVTSEFSAEIFVVLEMPE